MSGRILQKGKADDSKNCLPIDKGGTGSGVASIAAKNLKLITNSMKNTPNGPIGISSNGLISASVLPPGLSFDSSINITGPLSLSINQVQAYTITDYDINTTYTLVALGGSISRSGNTITYTAPGTTGSGGFTINGKTFAIAIGVTLPNTPSITSPSTGSTNLLSSVNFTANAFSMLSGTDTHEGSDWQIATDAGFTSIVSQVTNDSTNKTSWTVTTLAPSTTYYARVRYKGAIYGYSAWSSTINFSTKSVFTPTTEEAVLVGSPRANFDQFGNSVSMSGNGNVLVVGAPNASNPGSPSSSSGAIFIYNKSGGSYTQEIKIGENGVTGVMFGQSVAISNDGLRIVIGHPGSSPSGLSNAGKVYIYSKVSGSWLLEAALSAPDKISGDYFGWSVDIDATGSRIVVGSKLANPSGVTDAGSVYIFSRTDVNWALEQTIFSSVLQSSANFGSSVAIDDGGNRIVVGAPFENKTTAPAATNRGYVYVYSRNITSWTLEQKISQGGTDLGGEWYGSSVDIDSTGTRIVITSVFYNSSSTGAAFVLSRTGTVWTLESTLSSGEATDRFGEREGSVSINSDGSVIAIGNDNMTISGNSSNGAVFMFTRLGTTWSKMNRLNTTLQDNEDFGWSTALTADGSKVFIGARDRNISSIQSGAAYTFV